MSFCSEVKSEICNHKLNKRCCRRTEFYGLMLGIKVKKDGRLTFKTTNISVAERVRHGLYADGIDCEMVELKDGMHNVLSLQPIGLIEKSFSDIEKNCCIVAYIRGAFLSCGQLSNPGSSYRIDFNLKDMKDAVKLKQILDSAGFEPRISQKSNGKACLYIKNSSQVEDLMTYMGAPLSSLGVMEIRVEKDYKNHINRAVNFETANFVRTYGAAELQVNAIEKIKDAGLFDELTPDIKEIATARLENADVSLARLSEITGISKSAVNRRLNKIIEISNKI